MSNFEKLFEYFKDNEIDPLAVLTLIKVLLEEMDEKDL